MWQRLSVLLLVTLCLGSPLSEAAGAGLLVFDDANWLQNTISAVQSTAAVANQLIDLLQVSGLIGEDAALTLSWVQKSMQSLGRDGQLQFRHDFDVFNQEFDVLYPPADQIPCTQADVRVWRATVQQQSRVSAKDAMRSQGTIWAVDFGMIFLRDVFPALMQVIGNLQGHQLSMQLQAMIMRFQAHHQTMSILMDRAHSSVVAQQATEQSVYDCLRDKSLETWGR